MPDGMLTVGWDIGGAHLKAARLAPNGRLERVDQLPCPLWRGLEHLDAAIGEVLDALPAEPVLHAVTMTGELADLFPDRSSGVASIAGHFDRIIATRRRGDAVRYWAGVLNMVSPAAVVVASEAIASANWLATASCCAKLYGDGLLVDIGSTTTDIVPFAAQTPCPRGRTDAARLESGELVYLGVVRTPLMALADRVPVAGRWRRCMNEHFATMADVMRLCGELDEATDHYPAADSGAKTRLGSTRRLLRMVAEDTTSAGASLADELARWYRARLIDTLAVAAGEVLAHASLPSAAPLVAAGIGAGLVRDLAQQLRRPLLSCTDALAGSDTAPEMAVRAAHCAPAVAVARLAQEEFR